MPLAQLQVAGVAQATLNNISSMKEVVLDLQSQAKDAALKCLSSQDTSIKDEIEQSFEKLENPFTCLNSESKRTAFLNRNGELLNL